VLLGLGAVILLGLGSRLLHSGYLLVDKYAGDALYAVMVYLLLALCGLGRTSRHRGLLAMAIMTALELFQLTGVPLSMVTGTNPGVKIVGRLLGTTFSWHDLAAYGVGIVCVVLVERFLVKGEAKTDRRT
jgi:hypothetical protein